MSSILEPIRAVAGLKAQPIEVKRLDGIFESAINGIRDPRVLLKMDTQGYDLKVFEGARAYLDRIDALQSELSVSPLYHGMPHDSAHCLRALTRRYFVVKTLEHMQYANHPMPILFARLGKAQA